MVIIVFGLPGSGKSYFAERFATLISATYISSDRVRRALFSQRTYSEAEKGAVYDEMLKQTVRALPENVILDATFHTQDVRDRFARAMPVNVRVIFIEVTADEDTINNRLKKTREYSEADIRVHHLIRSEWQPMKIPHLVLQSTDHNLDDMLEQAIQFTTSRDDRPGN